MALQYFLAWSSFSPVHAVHAYFDKWSYVSLVEGVVPRPEDQSFSSDDDPLGHKLLGTFTIDIEGSTATVLTY